MNIVERILQLQSESGLNNKELEQAVGLANASITSWKGGKYSPSVDAIIKIAKYFQVTTDYLLCLSDQRNNEPVGISLSDHERLLVDTYREADAEGQMNIIYVCMDEKKKAEAKKKDATSIA